MEPLQCSIYDPSFWQHERFWKLVFQPAFYNGTPFKPVVWRLLGVRVGRRVFDDGTFIPERTLVTIGDGCTINAGTSIQAHSQEDGGFKRDRITIGSGVTIGVSSWVHYGVTMGDGAELAPDAFLMKGSEVEPGTRWVGNPAEEVSPREAEDGIPARELPTPAPVPPPRSDDGPHSLEELMDVFREDPAPSGADPLTPVPVPRRAGRHRARGRHLAATR
jgi:carbonic anhydrase/acetyltransferase-like protein (isoleucine patch superfamily)